MMATKESAMARYQTIRFFGLAVNTGPSSDSNARLDVDARCQLIQDALTTAALLSSNPDSRAASSCLNVFVVPEFYFRGPRGAYCYDDIVYLLGKLFAIAATPALDGWVICFGTAVAEFQTPGSLINFCLTAQCGPNA